MPSDAHSAPFHLRPNITSHSQANSRDLSYPSQPKEDPRSTIPHSKWLNRGSLLTDNTLSLPDAVRKGTTTPTSPLPVAIAAAVGIKIDPILTHRAPRSQREEQQQACRRDCEDASDRLCRSPAHPAPSRPSIGGPDTLTLPISPVASCRRRRRRRRKKTSRVSFGLFSLSHPLPRGAMFPRIVRLGKLAASTRAITGARRKRCTRHHRARVGRAILSFFFFFRDHREFPFAGVSRLAPLYVYAGLMGCVRVRLSRERKKKWMAGEAAEALTCCGQRRKRRHVA